MPVIQPVNILPVEVGAASNFRANINTNFSNIEAKIAEIIENKVGVVLSATKPPENTMLPNDIWLRILD